MKNFISNANNAGVAINDTLLKAKAIEIAKVTGQTEFKGSNGYLENFKSRNGVKFKAKQGDANLVPGEVVSNWEVKLKELVRDYEPKDIFNADELGFFWRLQPNKTYLNRDEKCKLGKESKERITFLVCASMMGEKYELVVIGKSESPRNINEINKLPLMYDFNKTAWMTADIFHKFLKNLNIEMIKQKRKILLFVDNCSAHPDNMVFSNVKIEFLPPNSTSRLKPMDAGVIKCLKGAYRLKLAYKLVSLIDASDNERVKSTAITLFHAIEMLKAAWDDLSPSTISNCFRHCGFFEAKCSTEPIELVEPEPVVDMAQYVNYELNKLNEEFKNDGTRN